MPANSNDRRRLPTGQTALTPAERQTRRREKLRQEEQDRWWAAEQECRAAEDAVEQADMASEAAWGPVNAIAERIAQELKAITDAVDLAAAGAQLDAHVLADRQELVKTLFTEHAEALAQKRDAQEAYRAAVQRRHLAWKARETIERQQDRRRRRSVSQ